MVAKFFLREKSNDRTVGFLGVQKMLYLLLNFQSLLVIFWRRMFYSSNIVLHTLAKDCKENIVAVPDAYNINIYLLWNIVQAVHIKEK